MELPTILAPALADITLSVPVTDNRNSGQKELIAKAADERLLCAWLTIKHPNYIVKRVDAI